MKRLILLAPLFLIGCQAPTLPDPNDPRNAGTMAPDVLRQNLAGAADAFFDRVQRGEISDEEAKSMLRAYASGLLKNIRADQVIPARAWEYAEVLIAADRWADAEKMLLVATKNPSSEDRRVNDLLRLARAQAKLGNVKSAIASAEETFSASPQEKAPILIAILLEVVPAAEGKGSDLELAKLLEGAITQGTSAQVDLDSDAGKMYKSALPFHVQNATKKAVELYLHAGRADLAQALQQREKSSMNSA